jgi:hypothetical protein
MNIYHKKITLTLCFLSLIASPSFAVPKFSPEQINYIKGKYEHTLFNKEHLFYPAQHAKRLLIFFGGAVRGKYIMWSWFWDQQEKWHDTAYLFIRDDDFCWYIGNDAKDFFSDYANLINHYISVCNLRKDQVFTIGGSMGGYGAIYYATRLELKGAIAICPQVNKASNFSIFGLGITGQRWQDLEKIVATNPNGPCISLIFSYFPSDEAAGYALIDKLKAKLPITIIRRYPSNEHSGGAGLSKEFIENEVNYLDNQIPFIATKSLCFDEDMDGFESTMP